MQLSEEEQGMLDRFAEPWIASWRRLTLTLKVFEIQTSS